MGQVLLRLEIGSSLGLVSVQLRTWPSTTSIVDWRLILLTRLRPRELAIYHTRRIISHVRVHIRGSTVVSAVESVNPSERTCHSM